MEVDPTVNHIMLAYVAGAFTVSVGVILGSAIGRKDDDKE